MLLTEAPADSGADEGQRSSHTEQLGKAEPSENTRRRQIRLSGNITGLRNKVDKYKNKLEMEAVEVISDQRLRNTTAKL